MYDFTWKYETAEDMVASGKGLGAIIQSEIAVLHGPKTWMRGVAVFDDEQRLVDLRVLSIAPEGGEYAELLGEEDDPEECGLAPIERAVKGVGCTDFILWTYGDDSGTQDMTVVSAMDMAAQLITDGQETHGIHLRSTIYVGRSPGHGSLILGAGRRPRPGSPSFMYLMAKRSFEIEMEKAPDDRSQVILDAMAGAMQALVDHVDYNKEQMAAAAKVAADRIRAKAEADPSYQMPDVIRRIVGLDKPQRGERAASPFDLPELKLPKPEKGLLN